MRDAIIIRNTVAMMATDHMGQLAKPCPEHLDAAGIWSNLVFCILSSQVRAEVAKRLADSISSNISFFVELPTYRDLLHQIPLAMRLSGTSHRFPVAKTKQLAESWFCFSQIRRELPGYLYSEESSYRKRDFLRKNFSGLGMKQASMFLRDIGAVADLAIIDSHMLYYLNIAYDFPAHGVDVRSYRSGENLLQQEAGAHGLSLSEYDHILWTTVRHVRLRRGGYA